MFSNDLSSRYCTQLNTHILRSGGHIFDVCSSFKACQSNVGIPPIYRVKWTIFKGEKEREKLVNLIQEFYLPSLCFYLKNRMAFQTHSPTWKMDAIRCPSIAIKNYFFFILVEAEAISSPFNISLLRDVANSLITSPYFFEWIWELHFDENNFFSDCHAIGKKCLRLVLFTPFILPFWRVK